MAFVLQFSYETHQKTIPNFIVSILRKFEIESSVTHENGQLVCAMREDHPRLQEALETMETVLPSSIFIRGSSHRFEEGDPTKLPEFFDALPMGQGVCPQCQKEMLDTDSRRYYYPFTSCKSCGGQYALFERYPYIRENTKLRFTQPCKACEEEFSMNPFRESYPQIGCQHCAVSVKFTHTEGIFHATDAQSYKIMFEEAAKLIAKGERVRIKTLMGYRTFFQIEQFSAMSVLMVVNPSRLTNLFALIDEELQALLSIERPILHVAIADEVLKSRVGNSVDVQTPDEGFSFLLGKELHRLGIDTVGFECVDETGDCNAVIEFDLAINDQTPMKLFVNKEVRFIAQGERGSFPAYVIPSEDVASFAHGLAAVREGDRMIIDQTERFAGTTTTKVNALSGEDLHFTHGNLNRIDQDIASCMAVLHENGIRKNISVCAYFDENITFLHVKNGHVTRVVPSEPFSGEGLIERISVLREGSDRLMRNLKTRYCDLYSVLEKIEGDSVDMFQAAAMIMGLDNPDKNALIREALRFVGKGGLQIDTKLKDNRFDHVAFLASIISYKIADVPTSLLCYSIFESLGDYFSDILTELKKRAKAEHIVLCGSGFANQSLYSRVARNLKNTPPVLSRSFPIGRENGVVGGIYL